MKGDQIGKEFTPTQQTATFFSYSLLFLTGNQAKSSDLSSVSVSLVGENGQSGSQVLDFTDRNEKPFQRCGMDQFTIKSSVDLGKLSQLTISMTGKFWFLDKIFVYTTSTKSQTSPLVFPCNRLLTSDSTTLQIGDISSDTSYRVSVKTGTKFGAGTDAKVFLVLIGEKQGPEVPLDYSLTNKLNKFEAGSEDVFIVPASGLGPVKSVIIGHGKNNFHFHGSVSQQF